MSDIHIHVHIHPDEDLIPILNDIRSQLAAIQRQEITELATLADLQAKVAQEDTVIDSATALISGLAQQVKDLTPDQAAIDALAADIDSKQQELAAAITANTPASTQTTAATTADTGSAAAGSTDTGATGDTTSGTFSTPVDNAPAAPADTTAAANADPGSTAP